tara:strand:- start:164 stop:787 length:624 start_codon:yes stop_codon:yes gene_type:complete
MFTGIITDIGRIIDINQKGDLEVKINTNYDLKKIQLGASISHDGVCLTVTDIDVSNSKNCYTVELSAETISKTNILKEQTKWVKGKKINLERPLKVGDELGGHIVTGHVDGLAKVVKLFEEGDSTRMTFEVSDHLSLYIASKGSVCLNGTSLTVNEVDKKTFGINFIPHTKANTTWGDTKIGDYVNLEIDVLARYVEKIHHSKRFNE